MRPDRSKDFIISPMKFTSFVVEYKNQWEDDQTNNFIAEQMMVNDNLTFKT